MKIHHVLATVLTAATVALLPSSTHAAPTAEPKNPTTVGVRTASKGAADDRGKYEYEILPKQSRQDAIAVYNYSMKPVTVRLLARDAVTTPDGEFSAQESSVQPKDIGSWIALDKQTLRLEPRSMSVVPFQVGVPYNATPGDHTGSVLVSLLAKEPKAGGGTVVVEHRVGLRVYLRVPGTLKPELTVEKLKQQYQGGWLGKGFGFGRPVVDYTVRNTGNVRLSTEQQVEILRSFGLSSDSAEPKGLTELLPGGHAVVHQEFDRTWAVGNVTAKVTLTPAGLDESVKDVPDVTKETSVFVFPWLLLLVLLLVVTGGVLGERRRRRLKALRLPGGSRRAARSERPKVGALSFGALSFGALSFAALVVLAGALAAATAPAHAAEPDHPVWKADVLPKAGGADDPIELQTSGGCPKPADSILGKVYGKGFSKDGENVIGNTKAGVTPVGPFSAPLAFSMKEFMSEQPRPVALEGVYKFVVTCRTAKYPRSYADYVAAIRFTGPNRWVAAKPLTDEIGQNLELDENGVPIEEPGDGSSDGASGGATDGPDASDDPADGSDPSASGEADGSGQASDSPVLTAADEDSGSNTAAYLLTGAGVVVAALTGFVLWRRRA